MMADKKIVFLDIDGTFTVPLEKPTELASRGTYGSQNCFFIFLKNVILRGTEYFTF